MSIPAAISSAARSSGLAPSDKKSRCRDCRGEARAAGLEGRTPGDGGRSGDWGVPGLGRRPGVALG